MDFARKQLEKYGWTDGKGLGKNENGIPEALKPKLKRSVAGVGHDAASDFTEHWWTALYDKAADNVQIERKNGKTKKIKTKDPNEFVITNSTWRINKKPKKGESEAQYSNYFVRKSVLASGGVKMEKVGESSDDEVEERKEVVTMSDADLFAACGGRTAHKGARHGLKALGKLARIEQQEQELLALSKYKGYSQAKDKNNKINPSDTQIVEDTNLNSDVEITREKKKKKKKKRCISDETRETVGDMEMAECNEGSVPMVENEEKNSNDTSDENSETSRRKKKKSKRKNENDDVEMSDNISNNCDSSQISTDEKKSKRKNKDIEGMTNKLAIEDSLADDVSRDAESAPSKKRKKKKKTSDD